MHSHSWDCCPHHRLDHASLDEHKHRAGCPKWWEREPSLPGHHQLTWKSAVNVSLDVCKGPCWHTFVSTELAVLTDGNENLHFQDTTSRWGSQLWVLVWVCAKGHSPLRCRHTVVMPTCTQLSCPQAHSCHAYMHTVLLQGCSADKLTLQQYLELIPYMKYSCSHSSFQNKFSFSRLLFQNKISCSHLLF